MASAKQELSDLFASRGVDQPVKAADTSDQPISKADLFSPSSEPASAPEPAAVETEAPSEQALVYTLEEPSPEPEPVASPEPAPVMAAAPPPTPTTVPPKPVAPLTQWKEQIVRPAPLPPTPPELVPLSPHLVVENALKAPTIESAPLAAAGGIAVLTEAPPFPGTPATPEIEESVTADEALQEVEHTETPKTEATAPAVPQIIVPKSATTKSRSKKSAAKKSEKTGSSGLGVLLGRVVLAAFTVAVLFVIWTALNPTAAASDLSAGQCVEDFFPRSEEGAAVELSSVGIVECEQEHAYEVMAVDDSLFPEDEYPGLREAFVIGQQFCLNEYGSFIGGGQENLDTWDVWTFVPPESQWEESRVVQCLIGDATETTKITGTLQDAAATQ